MIISRSTMQTAHARKYLVQMCKHYSHKHDVAYSETKGVCTFPMGEARLVADEHTLHFELEAEAGDLSRMQTIIENHILRFAFREKLDWMG